MVVRALLDSDHKVAMLTGDALLTSLHVARQVGICSLSESNNNNSSDGTGAAGGSSGRGDSGATGACGGVNNLRLPLTLVGVEAGVVCPLPVYLPSNDTTTTGALYTTGTIL